MSSSEKTWDERVFERIASGVDPTIIRENLRLSPTERIEKMQKVLDFAFELRKAHANANRSSNPSGGSR